MSPTPRSSIVRNKSRRLDRLNGKVADVLKVMRSGATLQLQFCQAGQKWRTSNGHYVSGEVAKIIIIDKRVVGVGDTLFAGGLSQTWRYIEDN